MKRSYKLLKYSFYKTYDVHYFVIYSMSFHFNIITLSVSLDLCVSNNLVVSSMKDQKNTNLQMNTLSL